MLIVSNTGFADQPSKKVAVTRVLLFEKTEYSRLYQLVQLVRGRWKREALLSLHRDLPLFILFAHPCTAKLSQLIFRLSGSRKKKCTLKPGVLRTYYSITSGALYYILDFSKGSGCLV